MTVSQSQPAYFAVIPANVRYHPKLCANAKLLYGEITALCNKEGYSWATNRHFAELYGVDIRTIQRWLSSLSENGFISVDIEIDGKRKIYIITFNFQTPTKMSPYPDKNVMHNNTSNNKSSNVSNPLPLEKSDEKNVKEEEDRGSKNDDIFTKNKEGIESVTSIKEIFHRFCSTNYTTEEIHEAIQDCRTYQGPIHDIYSYLLGIMKKNRKVKSHKKLQDIKPQDDIYSDPKKLDEEIRKAKENTPKLKWR